MAALSRPRERIAELERQLWSMHEAAQALHAGGAQKEAEAQALRDKVCMHARTHACCSSPMYPPRTKRRSRYSPLRGAVVTPHALPAVEMMSRAWCAMRSSGA